MPERRGLGLPLLLVLLLAFPAQADEAEKPPRGLFERAVETLVQSFPDVAEPLRRVAERHREAVETAPTIDAKRTALFALLREVPTSHCGLLTSWGKTYAIADLMGQDALTLGLTLVRVGDAYHAAGVLRGGPAARVGIRRGDEIVTVDGVPPGESPRLDFRHDDAALEDAPAHWLRCEKGERITLTVRGRADQTQPVPVLLEPAMWSSLRSDRAGVKALALGEKSIGIIPLSMVYPRHTLGHVTSAMAGKLKDCDALVLDARGRGGSALAVKLLLSNLLRGDARAGRPMVLLQDRDTRSAKELLADGWRRHEIGRVVGEPTPGAVRPVRFVDIGEDTVLFCPHPSKLQKPRFALEGVGVEPDVSAHDVFAFADGKDPLLEAAVAEALRVLAAVDVAAGASAPAR